MRRKISAAAWLAAMCMVAVSVPASAQQALLDLSTAEQLQAAVQGAGYKAELQKNDDGSFYILSAANGEPFTIDLTDCKALKCNGLSFQTFYKPEPYFNADLANKWNSQKRFLKVSVNEKGEFREWMDVTTFGKLTKENFSDVIDWFVSMDAELSKFVGEARDAAKAKAKK